MLSSARGVDQHHGGLAPGSREVGPREVGNGVDPARRDDHDGCADCGAPLEHLERGARRSRVDPHRGGPGEAHGSERVAVLVERALVGQIQGALLGFVGSGARVAHAREHARLSAALLASPGEMIGDALEGAGLLERRRLGPGAARQHEEALGLPLGRDHRRQHRAPPRHPAGERAQLGAAHLQGVEDVGAQRSLRLGGCEQDERLGQLGLRLVEVSGRIHGRHARRMERPELRRGSLQPRGRSQRGERPPDGFVGIRPDGDVACALEGVEPCTSARPQRCLDLRRPRADDQDRDAGRERRGPHATRPLRCGRSEQRDAAARNREHDGAAHGASDTHCVGVERCGAGRAAAQRDGHPGDAVGSKGRQNRKYDRDHRHSEEEQSHRHRPLDHAELEAARAQGPLGEPEQDGGAHQDGYPRGRPRAVGHRGEGAALRQEASAGGQPPRRTRGDERQGGRRPSGLGEPSVRRNGRDGQARGGGARKGAKGSERVEGPGRRLSRDRRGHDGAPPPCRADRPALGPRRDDGDEHRESPDEPREGLASSVDPHRENSSVGHARDRRHAPGPRARQGDGRSAMHGP